MNTVPDTLTPHTGPSQPALKPLWIAIGALCAAVAALGGTLAYQNLHGDHAATAPVAGTASAVAPGMAGVQSPRDDLIEAPRSTAAVVTAPPATALVPVTQTPAPVRPVPTPVVRAPTAPSGYQHTPAYSPGYPNTPMPVAQICATCGRIESVTPVQRSSPTPNVAGLGIGAVTGGVLGGLLGNQIGHGSGRAAATVLGAVGGGYLGNTVEQRARTVTAYQVRVRMDDGSTRTFERAQAVPVGERVTLEGRGFRLGQGATYSSNDPYYRSVSQPQGSYSTTGQY
ncbi:outer membrane lipoprotein [Xylophilus ampelinus]|uniref:Glycine zipper 2TM protein n=1 Tax=Xylophilus ampelinus TaxID=54067 RepID=A0A318SZE5_9BURK|nr:glycine zipper 2TM domain-containing protein [Xylophilus ampelinus]MCS4509980.1 glycine zipper 2TM domain-containing protein [Xylophilus ampelinus]PYE78441.1 glycine zipper 2TM protein [Xylophilus ampelinus]